MPAFPATLEAEVRKIEVSETLSQQTSWTRQCTFGVSSLRRAEEEDQGPRPALGKNETLAEK
jgi:hypothetical protein